MIQRNIISFAFHLLFFSPLLLPAGNTPPSFRWQDVTNEYDKVAGYRTYSLIVIPSKELKMALAQEEKISIALAEKEITLVLHSAPLHDESSIIHLGDEVIKDLPSHTYQGYVDMNEGGSAAFTVDEGFIFGFFVLSGHTYFIEPYRDINGHIVTSDVYLYFDVQDLIPGTPISCGYESVLEHKITVHTPISKNNVCKQIDLAMAGDYLFLAKYNGLSGAVNQTEAVLNTMIGLFTDEFYSDISFFIPEHYYSYSYTTWTGSTSACELLSNFRTWGENGGFISSYDLAQFWTSRDLQNNTGCNPPPANPGNTIVGLAYLPSVCTSYSYLVLEDNNSMDGVLLRNLNAHEVTHTLGAEYHVNNSIMSSILGSYDNWASSTLNDVNDHLQNGSPTFNQSAPDCMEVCSSSCTADAGTLSTNGSLSITTSQSTVFYPVNYSDSGYYAFIITNTSTGLVAYFGSSGTISGATLGAGTYCIQGIAHDGTVSVSIGSLSPAYGGVINGNCYDLSDCSTSTTVVITQPSTASLKMKIKVILGGFHTGAGLMRTDLRTNNLLPLSQPYGVSPFNYGAVTSVSSLANNVVDWVLVELRDKNDENNVIARQVALLRNDGILTDLSGYEGVSFINVVSDYYFVVVYHRNHIGIMSNSAQYLPNSSTYNFTTSAAKAKGTGQLVYQNGYYVMIPGDFDGNAVINNLDYNLWYSSNSAINQYLKWDADGNAVINNLDYNLWYAYRSKIGYPAIQL